MMLGLTSNPIFCRALKHDGYCKGISNLVVKRSVPLDNWMFNIFNVIYSNELIFNIVSSYFRSL